MANKNLNDHILSDKVKWFVTAVVAVLLVAAVAAMISWMCGLFDSKVITVQAEATGAHGEMESYTVLTPSGNDRRIRVYNDAPGCEGTGCVENITEGDTLTFYVYVEDAGIYDLSVRTCSTIRRNDNSGNLSVDFMETCSVTVNGEQLELDSAVIPELDLPSGASIWFNWYDLALGSVTLEAGYNVITFECIGTATDYDGSARTPNFDCIDLVYKSEIADSADEK